MDDKKNNNVIGTVNTNQSQDSTQNNSTIKTDPTHPRVGSVISGGDFKAPSLKSKLSKKKVLLIASVITFVLITAGILFYFLYWTKSSVVYARFQKQISKIITNTVTNDIELTNDVAYKFEFKSESPEVPLELRGNGLSVDGNTDVKTDITYKQANLNLALLSTNSNNVLDLFIKWEGIDQFYKALLDNDNTELVAETIDPYINILKKYDNKWISVDIFNTASDDTASKNESITKDDYKVITNKLAPIFNDRYVGLDKDNAVFTSKNAKSDKVAGKAAWSYEITYSKNNYNDMIVEMVKAIDSTSLSENKKNLVKTSLNSAKDNTASNQNSSSSYDPSESSKTIIWIEKNTGLPLKYATNTETKINNKLSSITNFSVEISSISVNKITGIIKNNSKEYGNGGTQADPTQSELTANFSIDNKSRTVKFDAKFDPNNKQDKDIISAKLEVEPTKAKTTITRPTNFVKSEQILKEFEDVFNSTPQ